VTNSQVTKSTGSGKQNVRMSPRVTTTRIPA
jgi:hypothetical protein